MGTRFDAGASVAALAFFLFSPAHAADPPGILWQTTSQMTMQGMPFSPPPQSLKVCAPETWTRPPPGGDPSCVMSDYRLAGNKATWTMQCSGKPPMSGTGEMTFESSDAYTGLIKATAEGMTMTIRLTGKKIGTCDNPQ